jgi:hypothetical protein
MKINKQMHKAAIALTGDPKYETNHIVSFERFGTMEQQEENLGTIECPGFEDIAEVAGELICQAESALKGMSAGELALEAVEALKKKEESKEGDMD